MMPKIRITVWSDYVCPFCYLQEPVLAQVRQAYGDRVDVEWRAFELRPEPMPTLDPQGEYLQSVWTRAVYPMARHRNMTLRLPPVQPRSRSALELAEYAKQEGCFEEVHRRVFQAFFEDGRDLGRIDVLTEIGAAAGLHPEKVRTALERGAYRERVIQDARLAQDIGITAVPTAVVAGSDQPMKQGAIVQGAQPVDVVTAAVERALDRERIEREERAG